MKGEPLLPQKCKACEKVNKCFKQTCEYCSGDLKTPTRSSFQDEGEEAEELKQELKDLKNRVNQQLEGLE